MRKHGLPPILNSRARVLILGTLPGDESIRRAQYYAHPRNQFWPVMAAALEIDMPEDYEKRCALLTKHGIAVWDVLASAERDGSLDQAIKNVRVNDFASLTRETPRLCLIAFNGQKAKALYRNHVAADLSIAHLVMPSTSPANAQMTLAEKSAIWRSAISAALKR